MQLAAALIALLATSAAAAGSAPHVFLQGKRVAGAPAPAAAAAPGGAKAKGPAAAPKLPPLGVPNPSKFAELLPWYPDSQPVEMAVDRCKMLLNKVLGKSFWDPKMTVKLLPKCLWDKEQCKALEDDLVKRLEKSDAAKAAAAPGGAALGPAAAAEQIKEIQKVDYDGNDGSKIYGWCNVMADMARKNHIKRIKA